jgi:hypothetical protein
MSKQDAQKARWSSQSGETRQARVITAARGLHERPLSKMNKWYGSVGVGRNPKRSGKEINRVRESY